MGFNAWFFKKLFPGKKIERKLVGYLEGWISIIGNIILFLFKFFAGLYLNGISLIADAFHSLSDVLTSIVVILGFKLGGKPADKKHPFGHGRIEQIATIIIAFMLLIIAYDLGKNSIERILHPQKVSFNFLVIFLMFFSTIFKEWMARFSIFLGKRINSPTLIADAWHHRSDAIASLLVGIGLIFINLGFYFLDGVLGVGVSILLAWVSIDLIKTSSSFLIGEAPNDELLDNIEEIVLSTPGVLNIHDVMVHDYHNNKVISLHVEIDENLSAKEAHKIALEVQDRLKKNIENSNVSVHIDPRGERED
ncbi:MAG: cation diffusion facilitator family transporter [Dictyoglomaceae bacterium]